ncbi:metallophosphoesterase [Patescibacteria group bacterium]|nr:metallophosphoesterase [Patescibacteria group bacterium]
MKIGVLSDSHDQYENILKAVKILNKEKVELTIHCGDWVSPFTQKFYRELKSPLKGIFGNNDGDRYYHLVRAKETKIEFGERPMSLLIGGRKIFVYHGESSEITETLIKSGKYDAVFHGHTHISINKTIEKTLSLNPGTLISVTDSKIKGASFAIYDSETNSAKIIKL